MEETQNRPWHEKWRYRLPIGAIAGLALIGAVSNTEPTVKDVTTTAPIVQPQTTQKPTVNSVTTQTAPKQTEQKAVATGKKSCNPNYSGCLRPDASDYDCAGGSGNGPYYTGTVRVIGYDEYDLDRDNDGWGCEK